MPVTKVLPEYTSHHPDWQMLRDFDAGERVIKHRARQKTCKYLPRLSGQSDDEYDAYVERAAFVNATRRTVEVLLGLMFSRPVEVELGAAEGLRSGLDSFTVDGEPFSVFAQNAAREVTLMGRFGGLIDRTRDGSRVYGVGYPAENIRIWRYQYAFGIKQPTQIIVVEDAIVNEVDGFGYTTTELYRELSMGPDGVYSQQIYEPASDADGVISDLPTDRVTPSLRGVPLRQIPFVFFGPRDNRAIVERSPVLDVATLNLHHFRYMADLNWGRHFTALPTPVICGSPLGGSADGQKFEIGPSKAWLLDSDSKAEMLEFKGAGLMYLEHAIDQTERQMAMLGARLLGLGGARGSEAPDVAAGRERADHATLWTIMDACERGLTRMLQMWAAWQDYDPTEIQVRLNRDFRELPIDAREALTLLRGHRAGLLPISVVDEALLEGNFYGPRQTLKSVQELRKKAGEMIDPENMSDKL